MSEAIGEKAFVPRLRFPEFRGKPVDMVRLNTLASGVIDTHDPGVEEPVLTLSSEQGIVDQSTYFGKRVAGENTDRYTRIRENDFVYNDRITARSRYGTIRRLGGLKSGIVSPIYKCFRLHDEDAAAFYDFYFQTGKHDEEIRALVNEGARAGRYNLTINQFLSTRVPRVGADERRRVADCLKSLDDLIAAVTEKLKALGRQKDALQQQLLPVEGDAVPRLRFPKYKNADEWKTKTIQAVATIRSGTTPSRANAAFFQSGTIPWVKTMDLNNSEIRYTGEMVTESSGVRVNPPDSVLVAMYGGFNQIGRTGILTMPAATNQAIAVLIPKADELTARYLLVWLNANVELWKRVAASSRKDANITSTDVANFPISYPKIEEQIVVTSALEGIQSIVSSVARKLMDLQNHKAALMQQLFPGLDEVEA